MHRRLDIPLLGPRTQLRSPWADAPEAVLNRHDLEVADLRVPGMHRPFFGESPRKWLTETAGFAMSAPSREPFARGRSAFSRTLSFKLPRGVYTTVLLAALE